MAQKTFHIELKCINVDDPEKLEAVKKATSRAASTLHAKAMLICGGPTPPMIVIYGEDFRMGKKEIDMEKGDDET
jgi:hypothetical protein